MTWTARSTADLPHIAQSIMAHLGERRKVALLGDMGAGKTTFVRAICALLGVLDAAASSPTFSLINQYAFTDKDGQPALLHHLDLYRLKSLDEALDIGIEEVLYDPWFCFIEWPQVIEAILPDDAAVLRISLGKDFERVLELEV